MRNRGIVRPGTPPPDTASHHAQTHSRSTRSFRFDLSAQARGHWAGLCNSFAISSCAAACSRRDCALAFLVSRSATRHAFASSNVRLIHDQSESKASRLSRFCPFHPFDSMTANSFVVLITCMVSMLPHLALYHVSLILPSICYRQSATRRRGCQPSILPFCKKD